MLSLSKQGWVASKYRNNDICKWYINNTHIWWCANETQMRMQQLDAENSCEDDANDDNAIKCKHVINCMIRFSIFLPLCDYQKGWS